MTLSGPDRLTSLELCAGAGGLTLGLEAAGFDPIALLDTKPDSCATLRGNRPDWTVLEQDLRDFLPSDRPDLFAEDTAVDLLAAGLPRLPSTASTMRKNADEERYLLKATIWLAQAALPRAVLVENIPGLALADVYAPTRQWVEENLREVGYRSSWGVLNACDFGVPQQRPHGFLVALRDPEFGRFSWPEPSGLPTRSVGTVLYESMARRGWPGAAAWARRADEPAPTIVGGSDKRGGPDLGPTGSKRAWERLGVNGGGIGDDVPDASAPDDLFPKLTVPQVTCLQGFPADWVPAGRKTSSYRQIGNACPPPVASAVGRALAVALRPAVDLRPAEGPTPARLAP
ncbi:MULTISPECIES: DNA cytosine methyltransferase [Streptomyces]|uniref:DNA (cytosine-5-)-methyltransferase n=1 Tax=Streptomyces virginiae TaxID=1961 RepID=A0ABZ1TFC6_STRVG|nr:DNA cytosine methyltransferase [Streptomyces virginiae]WTB24517.1 DNA cytosine methyltransferase [Streptomyces virginiae]